MHRGGVFLAFLTVQEEMPPRAPHVPGYLRAGSVGAIAGTVGSRTNALRAAQSQFPSTRLLLAGSSIGAALVALLAVSFV